MQKNANRILSALLALVMIVSMLPATIFATGETEAVLTGWNVVLGENIGVNFHLNKEGYTVTTMVDGVEVEPEISGSKVTVNVSAAQMTDTIGLTVKDGETVVKEGEYSVRKYAEIILNDEHDEYDDYVKQMVKEMLNYGAAAQTYFAHNTGNPANKDYEQDPTATVPSEVPAISTTGTLPEGLELYGMTLIFQSRTAVRFYFKTTGNIADYTFKVGETPYTPVQKQGLYYIEVGNINPQNLHQPVTVTVNDGAYTVSYSPLDYIVRQYNKQGSSDKLKVLVEAMYCYHRQARYYVGMIPVGVLQANVNGHGAYGEGIYFSTQETNDAPYAANGAWEIYYDSASVDSLKLVRNGQTISVGLTGRNTICKFSANDYALRLFDYTIGDYAPFTTDDMFIIEGAFTHANSMTTLNIEKTYIYHDGAAWVFSAEEPVFEPETESPFTFDKGVFSADIFNNRNNGLSVSVENKQLKLQQPEGASNWLWIKQDMPAGTVVTMDVTFSGDGMSIFGYGAKENGDPITEGTVTESVPQGWFWGQGGSTSGSYTFTIYENCYGLSLMLGFAGSTETSIYIDNVVIILPPETQSPFTFDCGSFSADIFNNRNNGLSVSVENKQLKLQRPAGANNWLWIKQDMPAGTVVTMDVTFSGDGMSIFGYGSNANGDPITSGTVTDPAAWYNGQGGSTSGSYTFTIYEGCYGLSLMLGFADSTETAIYIDNVVITPPSEIVVNGGNMTESEEDGWDAAGDIFFTLAENDIPVDEDMDYPYTAESGVIKLVRGGSEYAMVGTVVKYGDTSYYLSLEGSDYLPLEDNDYLIVEGNFVNEDNGYTLNIAKTYVLVDGESLIYSNEEPDLSESYDVGVLQAHNAGAGSGGIYFSTAESNDAPWDDWNTYYDSASVDCLKLVRNGETISVGLTGRNTICKFGVNDYYLKLEEYTIGSYAPFTTDDMFIVEGAYTHANSKTTLNIAKTYIYHDGSAWVFSATEPVFEPETESPFTFDKGVFSADIFNNRNNGLSVSVENKQLKLQQPAGASNWLWIKQNMPAGTVVTMDVTFSGDGMSIFGYGAKENGDPITDGTVTESVPQGWFWGQGGSTSGSYTFNIYEDCYGLSLMLGFANSTETAIYIDNVKIILPPETESPFTFDCGSFSADIFNNRNNGLSVSVENKQLKLQRPAGANNWLWIKQDMPAGTVVTMDVTFSGDGMSIFGYGSNAAGDPITSGTVTDPAAWYNGQGGSTSGSYTFTIYEDCYGLSLMLGFANSTETAIYLDNIVITAPEIQQVYNVGNLNSHGAGVGTGDNGIKGIYATSVATGATSGSWSIEYSPVAAENYKLIRDGVTYNVGRPGEGTLVMFGQTEYYLKQENNTFDSSLLPLRKGDVLVVEGNWSCNQDAASVINITPTYILITGESSVKFMASMPNIVKISVLKESQNARAGSGFYATADANSAPLNGDWSLRYVAQSADAVKFVSGGTTTNVANTVAEMIAKFTESDYWFEGSTLGGTYANIAAGDMYIVDGVFYNAANDVYIDIDTTYIKFTESDEQFGSTEPDTTPAYEMGVLSLHSNGVRVTNGSIDGIYATGIAGTGAAYNTDWSYDYGPVSAENFKLIRDGVTYNVGVPGTRTLIMHDDGQFFLEILSDRFGGALPLQVNDILVLEGKFACNQNANSVINITTTYILIGNGVVDFSAEMPTLATVYNMGVLSLHSNGVRVNGGSIDGIYATGIAGTGAAYNTDWNCDYSPVSAENFKLIRDGVTYNVGVPGTRTLIMYGDGELFLEIVNGRFNGELPLQDEDILVLDGQFSCNQNAKSVINIDKTYILINNGKATFSATEPEILPAYELGVLTAHSNGVRVTNDAIDGIYATGKAGTGAAYNTDWNYDYSPVSAENYQLIRDGVTYNVGVPGTRTFIMYGDGELFLEIVDGRFNGELPLREGDILVLHGKFICNQNQDSVVNIEKTYITIKANGTVFSAEDPRIINVGTMYAHDAGYSTNDSGITGIYFMNDSNVVPANEDWSVRYAATETSNVKLIRNGVTQDIAIVGANTIVKMSDQAGWLCLEGGIVNNRPIVAGDVLIVEGAFSNSSNGYTMVIDKTYIIVGESGVTFTTHYAQTDYGAIVLPTVRDTLNIGMWNGSYHVFEDQRLQELKDAGITKIMGINTDYIGTDNVSGWLDRVYSYGISVIIDLRNWDGSTVPSYASHPGVIGFLMFDEPNTADFDALADLKAKFDDEPAFEGKLFYVNLFPECAADSSLGELTWWDQIIGTDLDYDEDYITEFLSQVDIKVLSWDNYSLIVDTDDTSTKGIRTDYFHNFEVMASKANENMPMWYTMLSAGHSTTGTTFYATPTAEELRWQMAVAMTYGVQNIDHYVYYSHEDGYSCMLQNVDGVYSTTALYNDILTVDNEYLSWDHIFMAYDWKGVAGVKAGSSSTMLGKLENNIDLTANGLASVSTTQDVLVGVFDYNGDKAYMVTNAGSAGSTTVGDGKKFTMTDATVTLNLADGDYKCVAVIDQGEITYVAVNNNSVTIPVSAYEGVFVIPVLN